MKKHSRKPAPPQTKTKSAKATPKPTKPQRPWSKAAKLKARQEAMAIRIRKRIAKREAFMKHVAPRIVYFNSLQEAEDKEKDAASIPPPDTAV